MNHVLITGGAGLVGSHLCDLFLKNGYAVTVVDNLITGRKKNIEHLLNRDEFEFIEFDVCQDLTDSKFRLISKYGLAGSFTFCLPRESH